MLLQCRGSRATVILPPDLMLNPHGSHCEQEAAWYSEHVSIFLSACFIGSFVASLAAVTLLSFFLSFYPFFSPSGFGPISLYSPAHLPARCRGAAGSKHPSNPPGVSKVDLQLEVQWGNSAASAASPAALQ